MIYNTQNTKSEQLAKGWTRSGTGPRVVLVQGSCRSVPYFNFFIDCNADNAMSVYFIDPFYYTDAEREAQKHNAGLRSLLSSVEWFVHEHFENFGTFNTVRAGENIYDLGLKPARDLSVPNYHNHFILFQDIVDFHHEVKPQARKDLVQGHRLNDTLQKCIVDLGLQDVDKFCRVCELSSVPQFGTQFRSTWMKTRYFWTCNHVTANFTTTIFADLARQLGLSVPDPLWAKWRADDPYSSHFTPITKYDVEHYGVCWPEPLTSLKAPA